MLLILIGKLVHLLFGLSVLEEELKSKSEIIKPATYEHELWLPTEDESDSERELVKGVPDKIKHVKFSEFSKLTPTEEPSGESSNITRKKRRNKVKFTSRRREINQLVQFLRERAKPISIYADDSKLIGKKIEQVRRDELNIIAIDVEKMIVKGFFAKPVDIACWVAVTKSEGDILLNTLIRIPTSAIERKLEEFRGIGKKMVRNGMPFKLVRRIVFNYCRKADRIITASPEGDFEALKISPEDYNAILSKIRDVGKLMSERKKAPFTIKFITYLLFRAENIRGLHSPVSDCHLKMLSYLYDYEYLEEQMKKAKGSCQVPVRKNNLG